MMRTFIDIVSLNEAHSLAHKPFSSVTIMDVVRAFLVVDDLRAALEVDWPTIFEDEVDLPGETFEEWHITPDQANTVAAFYAKDFAKVKAILAPIASKPRIPVTRRLPDVDPTRDLGIHWSFGREALSLTQGRGSIIHYGIVENRFVDWVGTITRAIHYWHAEHEITVVAGDRVELIKNT